MKKIFYLSIAFLCVLLVAASPVKRDPNTEYELVVLHTNDHHGSILPKDDKGGLAERATFVKQTRAANKNVLVLDAGDINTGPALSNMFKGEADIKGYNAIGYDAVAFGNHEFDFTGRINAQLKLAKFAWVSANVKTAAGKYLGKPYIIKNYKGFRVAVIGLTTNVTTYLASPDKSLQFTNEIEAAKEMIATVRQKEFADIVIILGHLGDKFENQGQITSVELAEAVSGVDLIIDGHTHSKFEEPLVVNNIPIVSANEWGKFMGEAKLKIKDGKITGFEWRPVAITPEAFPADAKVKAVLDPYVKKADASLKNVVMKTSAEFEFGNRLSRYREIASGDLVCDATSWFVNLIGVPVDFSFHNGGNVRAALPAGDVTKEQIMTMLPFDNYIYVVSLKGSDVIELFNFIGSVKQGAGGWAQMSKEVKYTITIDEQGNGKISDITISGQPIDPNKTYKIATNDYLAKGGDAYVALTKSIDTLNTSMTLTDIVIDYVQTLPQPVQPATDGRITVIGGVEP
jgi:5'-nucleotidase/UDP-sugar diphosphatase